MTLRPTLLTFSLLAALSTPLTALADAPPAPARQNIALPAADRAQILSEMREFLETVQVIVRDANTNDMPAVERAARKMGVSAMHDMPPALMQRLPDGFKMQGKHMHMSFETIADDARDLQSPQHSLQQLGQALGQCNACHRSYELTPIPEPGTH